MSELDDDERRESHDILGFEFTCIHEWKGKVRNVTDAYSGIYYPTEEIRVSIKWVENLGFWVHEMTEATIIQVLDRLNFDYITKVHYEGYKSTYIAHFISCFGANNGCSLVPATRKNTARW